MKKTAYIILSLLLTFCFVLPAAAERSDIVSLGRISVAMPEITVEIKGSGYEKSEISAALDSEKLSVENAAAYDSATDSCCAYILVDLSASMYGTFDLTKSNIVSFIEHLNDTDKIVLITFGEKEINTVLNGSETRDEAVGAVNALTCTENGTVFYEALSRAYQISSASGGGYDREYVIAFSDGIDFQKGGTTFDEVIKLYGSHALPLYAACSYKTSKDAADKFGELSRASGGGFSIIKSEEEFDSFLKEINDVTLVRLLASSNRADGREKQLSVNVGSLQAEYNVPIVRSIPDSLAPVVTDLIYDSEKDVFVISFSERVSGADAANAYKITDSKGARIEVVGVFYSESANTYEIKTNTPIYKGAYTFEFSGIRDESQEANALVGEQIVEVKESSHTVGLPLWAIILIASCGALAACITVVIIVLSAKKKSKNEPAYDNGGDNGNSASPLPERQIDSLDYAALPKDIVKHHIMTNDAVGIKLRIKTGKTSEQSIETSVVSSLIVGRSDICDIYIDDTKLSRQHFVIENDNGGIYITDLQSRNGTMLNGTRINSRQRIYSGDKILAGLSDIIITITGR